ncbi:MAG: CAP domain-containing protein [Thiohalocapsa sp.]|uniref:CAP domain-containing protein n=1 Tax=Thiohalocapsa sp. TaxID=2497641 RepID=UPI0025D538A7|nr:CAP domain-containing protein [Thiohalocapsa sp.]MCG6940494.1 CAP domain-containing protein [Thiohalocapsa sp.]
MLLASAAVLTALPAMAHAAPSLDQAPDPTQAAAGIVEATNAFRQQQDREPLQVDPRLAKAAADFARFMARTGRFGHRAGGSTPAERVRAAGYDFCAIAENIAFQFSSAGFTTEGLSEAFTQGWKTSAEHRRNMLLASLTETGVGVAQGTDSGRWYAVQIFGRPESLRRSFSIRNAADVPITYRVGEDRYRLPPRYTRTHYTCEPAELRVQWPHEQGGERLTPDDGAALRIERGGGGELRLRGR